MCKVDSEQFVFLATTTTNATLENKYQQQDENDELDCIQAIDTQHRLAVRCVQLQYTSVISTFQTV